MKSYLAARLKERSTWQGLVAIGLACGLQITPDQASQLVSICVGLAGLIHVASPDAKGA